MEEMRLMCACGMQHIKNVPRQKVRHRGAFAFGVRLFVSPSTMQQRKKRLRKEKDMKVIDDGGGGGTSVSMCALRQ
jgi:hypothetical protein